MARRTKKTRDLSEWSKRLLGVALCSFFGLGVLVGARTQQGNTIHAIESGWQQVEELGKRLRHLGGGQSAPIAPSPAALVRHGESFYLLNSDGNLSGPVPSASQADLPILSGSAINAASGRNLVEYAAIAVRAEALLSQTVSELKIERYGLARLYLADSPTEIIFDIKKAADELERAAEVIRRWRGREQLIAAIDVTPSHEAIVLLRVKPKQIAAASSSYHGTVGKEGLIHSRLALRPRRASQ